MILCEGCQRAFATADAVFPVEVNLRDGGKRELLLCADTCADFWDDTVPDEWVILASGESVQRIWWLCDVCQSMCHCESVRLVIDTWDEHPDLPRDYPQAACLVCATCRRKEPGRYREQTSAVLL